PEGDAARNSVVIPLKVPGSGGMDLLLGFSAPRPLQYADKPFNGPGLEQGPDQGGAFDDFSQQFIKGLQILLALPLHGKHENQLDRPVAPDDGLFQGAYGDEGLIGPGRDRMGNRH